MARVLRWCKAPGDAVAKDEPLLELETDKVTVEIPAPASGELAEILLGPDAEVTPGQVLGRVRPAGGAARQGAGAAGGAGVADTAGAAGAADAAGGAGARASRPSSRGAGPAADDGGRSGEGASSASGLAESGAGVRAGSGPLSPAVRALLREHALEPSEITGSGEHGRITVADVERHIDREARAASGGGRGAEATAGVRGGEARAGARVPHTPIRRRVAEHMARSLAESPHVTTVFEVDLSRIEAHRAQHLAAFEARGVRLTYTAYFVLACARALKAHPAVNATYHEDALELHPDANIGVGTALGERGLIVPVIRRAQTLDLENTARRLGELVEAARAGTLKPDDVRGGTFTISNHGVSGSLLAAPIIIHQPQVAILGVGKVERRVRVLESEAGESLGVRSMCYLTLSLDHRALDAYQANAFMSDLKRALEQWS
jgi:2-oxoglutarate dehydrogenase E2 component (dihydrolipoamide succinyltransferase)